MHKAQSRDQRWSRSGMGRGGARTTGAVATVAMAAWLVVGCATGFAPVQPDAESKPPENNNTAAFACGNGIIDPGEECDDGNTQSGDGCGAICQVESCGAGSCPTGCCDAQGQCHPGDDDVACGGGGGACDDCTVGARTCEERQCVEVTECTPGEQETCGNCGARYCDTTGHWGPCVGEGCQPGLIEQSGSCGNCGTLERTCDPQTCTFGSWACVGEGVCQTGDVELGGVCGNGGHEERLCSGSCQWEPWTCEGEGSCTSGTVETGGSCGNCGTLERTCTNGSWGPWTCTGQGVCTAGTVQQGSDCGNCGTSERTCDTATCQWSPWTCTNEGVCAPGTTETGAACTGGFEERTCDQSTCQWGAWTCNGGCPVAGHLGNGENGDPCDVATQDEKWRCVFSTTLNAWVSQVCRDFYQPGVVWQWVNFAISPTDCAACCDTNTAGCG